MPPCARGAEGPAIRCPCIGVAPEPRPGVLDYLGDIEGQPAVSVLTLPARNECAAASDQTVAAAGHDIELTAMIQDRIAGTFARSSLLPTTAASATGEFTMCASDHRRTTTRTSAKRDRAAASSLSLPGCRPVCAGHDGCVGSMASRGGGVRRWTHRISDTGAMPSRAAAALTLRDVRTATNRSVAFSISASDVAA